MAYLKCVQYLSAALFIFARATCGQVVLDLLSQAIKQHHCTISHSYRGPFAMDDEEIQTHVITTGHVAF